MALKALDIFKLLPKTNCKKCGCPTCLAFAMKLAQKKATLDECPDVTDEAKAELEGSAAPPIRLVTIGTGENKLEIGNETVMFRHDESFYHPPGLGVVVNDDLDEAALAARLEQIAKLRFIRVGAEIRVNVVAIANVSDNAEAFARAAGAAAKLDLPIVLMSSQPGHLSAALKVCGDARPLLHTATEDNWEELAAVAKAAKCPLAVSAPDLDAVAALAEKIKATGHEDLVLDLTAGKVSDMLQALTAGRRLALKRKVKGLGWPAMTCSIGKPAMESFAECCAAISKYAGLVLTDLVEPEQLLPLLTLSTNIYTDPRKPIQVEPKLYEVGAVTSESPLLITTNFSLTYYTVEGEVEASRVPAYVGVIDTEGTSVLTAFASDKLSSENVAAFLNSDEVSSRVSHRKVIIPGYISAMSGALEEDSHWQVMVGPREASGISKFLKTVWKPE